MKKLYILTIAMCMMNLIFVNAQNVIPSSGGNIIGSGGSVSFSVGQVVYNTNTGTNASVAQGVQQPYEISIVNGIEEANSINLYCAVYPNPTRDFIKLRIENYKFEKLTYQLYDISGKQLSKNKIENAETNIFMKNFVPATYLLKIFKGSKELKTFKIIKN